MDINSDDIRHCVFLRCPWMGDLPVRSTVHESVLAQEVQRLGITIPAKRIWRLMDRHYNGVFEDGVYGLFVSGVPRYLFSILDKTQPPDEERRVILERFLTSLRTEEPHLVAEKGYILVLKIADQHGVDFFDPAVAKQLRESEFWDEEYPQKEVDKGRI